LTTTGQLTTNWRFDACHMIPDDPNANDRRGALQAHTQFTCAVQIPDGDAVWIAKPIVGTERGADQVIGAHIGNELRGVFRREKFDAHAETALQGNICAIGFPVSLIVDQEKIAALLQSGMAADLFVKTFQALDAVERETNVDFGGELMAHPCYRPGSRAADLGLFFLQYHDIGAPTHCQVVRDRSADDPGADNHNISGLR
jgi:hypothetical protein